MSETKRPDLLVPVLFFGDSHTRYFDWATRQDLFAPRRVEGKSVGGATAVGMRNPNSLSDAIRHFRAFMANKDRDAIVVTHLGEVDCGFVIWYRADKYGESPARQLEESIAAYFAYVDELRGQGFFRFVITGATLPTISDTDQTGDVLTMRKGITATMRERTELTFQYNARLRAEALRRGLLYTDVTGDVLDPDTGLVRSEFRNPDVADHHMDFERAAAAWARRLNECFACFD